MHNIIYYSRVVYYYEYCTGRYHTTTRVIARVVVQLFNQVCACARISAYQAWGSPEPLLATYY